MIPLDRIPNPATAPLRTGVIREFTMRQDRPPPDLRIDMPEIQESFRVSFSEAALAASAEGNRDVLNKPGPTDEGAATELKLRAYLFVGSL